LAALPRLEISAIALLLGSGGLHLLVWMLGTESWDSPLSFRKPALFGISTGLTLWSCLWVFSQLRSSSLTTWLRRILTGSLVVEVALITLQAWRGVASHFNRATPFDAAIESTLLLLISIATLLIFWLTAVSLSSGSLNRLPPPERLAARAGLALLSLSCLLGFLITFVGNQLVSANLPPETYPLRGVLKFPHGAALHAIQTLVVLAWLCPRLGTRWPLAVVWTAILAHLFGLLFALLQTFRGKARFELDLSSGLLLATTLLLLACSFALLFWPRSQRAISAN
jgi:hypothetical protein